MQDPLLQAERRAQSYWYADGLADLVAGTFFLLLSALQWAALYAQSRWALVVRLGWMLAILGGALLVRWVVIRLKWYITFPRTGYVRYRRISWRRRGWVLLGWAGLGSGVLLVADALVQHTTAGYLLLLGAVLALLYGALARRRQWTRGYGYAVLSLVAAGVSLGVWRYAPTYAEFVLQGGLFFVVLGVAQVLGGSWTLARYMRQHPVPQEEMP